MSNPTKSFDVTALSKDVANQRSPEVSYAVVVRSGTDSHWEKRDGDILVEVELQPSGTPLTCVLGSFWGSADGGAWRVPPVGTEVLVLMPNGSMIQSPTIVAGTCSGSPPDELDETTLVIKNKGPVRIIASDSSDVSIETGGVVKVNGDSFAALKTDTWLSYFNTFLAALKVDLAAAGGSTTSCGTPIVVGTYKSTKLKHG